MGTGFGKPGNYFSAWKIPVVILQVLIAIPATVQDGSCTAKKCIWSDLQYENWEVQSVGSEAFFAVTVSNLDLCEAFYFTWYKSSTLNGDKTALQAFRYNSTSGEFEKRRDPYDKGNVSIRSGESDIQSNLTISELAASDNSSYLIATYDLCDTTTNQKAFQLRVSYCDNNSFVKGNSENVDIGMIAPHGYNDPVSLPCSSGYKLDPESATLFCDEDAKWMVSEGGSCLKVTTTTTPASAADTTKSPTPEPSASPTAATPPVDSSTPVDRIKCDNRSIEAGNCIVAVGTGDVKFTFIYRCPENTCIVLWELEYDGYSSNSTVNVTSGAADCSVNPAEYSITCDVVDEVITTTITIAKLDANVTLSVYSDANLRRVIENNGLELIDRKDITVIYCPDFGEAEVDAESGTCPYNQYNCTFTFSCNDDDKKVVSTCQANATWSVMPDSVCSGVSVCCLYWLVSLIAFLIDVPIILLLVISCKESCSCACCPSESDLRNILIGSIAAAGVSFTGTLVGALVCETAGRIVTLVFGCTSLAWELPAGIYYLVVYVCEKKTK